MNGNANQSSTVVVSANNVAVSNNKRKIGSGGGRQNSTRNAKTKGMDKTSHPEGIYSNQRFMNVSTSLVGCIIRVQTVEGPVYEGIFRTFSPQFELVMEMGHKVDPAIPPRAGQLTISSKDDIIPTLIFSSKDVVMMISANTDLDYATKDTFTDTAISKFNGQVIEKELEPWDGIGTEADSLGNLDIENANGWDVNDMFRTNEQQYGVQSSYDHSLSGYTTPLEKKNTDEYKKQEAKALKLASEIESSSSHRVRSAVEDVDEDEKMSSVIRTVENNFVGKNISSQKKKYQHSGKSSRSSNLNSSSQGSSSYGGGRMGPGGGGGLQHLSHSQIHGGSGYNRLSSHSNNASNNNNNSSCPPQAHQTQPQPQLHQNTGHSVNSQPTSYSSHYQHNVHRQPSSPPAALANNLASNINVAAVGNGSASSINTSGNNVSGGGCVVVGVGASGSGNDVRKTSPLHTHSQQQIIQNQAAESVENRLNCELRVAPVVVDNSDSVDNNKNKSPQHHQQQTTSESVRREAIVANEARNDNSSSNEQCNNSNNNNLANQQSQSSNQIQLGNNHIQQKLPRKTSSSKGSREETTAGLMKFKDNFKLPSNEDKEESNNVATASVDESEVKEKVENELEKSTNGFKKFTLNPNAKEFVLNPNAKAFTPRTPIAQTPTPPRAHTPGAMMPQPAAISFVPGQPFITMPQYMMQSSHLAVSLPSSMGPAAPPLAMHPSGRPRFPKNDSTEHYPITSDGRRILVAETPFPFATQANVQHRPDYTGAMAAAATGQPILASTTHQSQASFVQYPPQAMVAAHGAPQPNMPYATQMYSVIGPRLVNPQGLNMMPGAHLVQHTDPQHVPSQMFIHPGVHPSLTPGPTPPHANHNPIPNMNQGGPHNASNQGQPPQQNQVNSMHPNPSPVHGNGNSQTQNQSTQPSNNPNNQQLNAYSNPHAQQMAAGQLQGAPHTPNSPQSMHPGQVNNSNPTHYLQTASIVAHAASNASQHPGNQAHPHQTQFPGTQIVLIPQPGPGTPTSMTGHPTQMTHTLQGHALGHGGVPQLLSHNSMVIPATTAGPLQAGAHQIFMQHPGRPNTLQGRVLSVQTPSAYQL
ncbi:hypothetical protein CHUAL_005920 [Chamberlinius hualienensis]